MPELVTMTCAECKGTGKNPRHAQKDGRCLWCLGKGMHQNIPYPMFCLHPEKCAGRSCCPRDYACCD